MLERLAVIEREVRSWEGRWFLARLLPYRTLEDRIDGVVATFVDISARKANDEALRQSEERFRLLVEGADDYAMFLLDAESRITFWSSGAERTSNSRVPPNAYCSSSGFAVESPGDWK